MTQLRMLRFLCASYVNLPALLHCKAQVVHIELLEARHVGPGPDQTTDAAAALAHLPEIRIHPWEKGWHHSRMMAVMLLPNVAEVAWCDGCRHYGAQVPAWRRREQGPWSEAVCPCLGCWFPRCRAAWLTG